MDEVMTAVADFIGDAAKIAGFVAIITYGVNMIIKAAKGKTRFL